MVFGSFTPGSSVNGGPAPRTPAVPIYVAGYVATTNSSSTTGRAMPCSIYHCKSLIICLITQLTYSRRCRSHYSVLSARTGSTDAARRAGITPATQAAASSIPTATTNEPLLTVVSSYSCDFTSVTP